MQLIARWRHGSDHRTIAGTVFGISLMILVTGCGGGGEASPLEEAQARVSAAEEDLADANADFTDASAEFCGASATYITGLDTYGDVLSNTAPTVGDVTSAGAELADPQDDVTAAADSAVEAQQAVVEAQQELADAQAALAAAQNSGSPAASTPAAAITATPLLPAATVSRVQTAESEFSAAQQGITAETPLVQASQQFNAAAVALEMAWLRLFADAGCLTDDQQAQAVAAVTAYTTSLQQSLLDAGYYTGEVDGVYGPSTVAAVEALQQAHGLPSTGTVDKATAAALQADLEAKGGVAAQQTVASTAAVQQTLKLAGFWDGPVDGEWTPALTDALMDFQTELGVEPTGTIDAATIAAFEKAITEAQSPPSDAPTPTEAPTSPTASPTTT